jgi:ferredoxin
MVSASGLWDQNANDYDAETLRAAGIDRAQLADPAGLDQPLCDLLPEYRSNWPAFVLPSVTNFQLPGMAEIVFGPRFLHNFLRKHTLPLPVCDDNLCELCSKCWTICPAQAITPLARNIEFNYTKCIRCYCCIEVCPCAALHSRESLGSKIMRKLIDKFS